MKTIIPTLLICFLSIVSAAQTTTWVGDSIQSEITFNVSQMFIARVKGDFSHYEVVVQSDALNFENAKINVIVYPRSIDTKNEVRDAQMLTDDYFYTALFDTVQFVSTEFKLTEEKKYSLKGNLTMLGNTKPIELEAEFLGFSRNMYLKKTATFEINGIINRSEFNMPGTFLVGKKVKLKCNVELVIQE